MSDHLSLPPEQLAVGVVPHRATPLVPLAEADRSAYLRHLAQIIKAAFDTREPQPEHTRDQASETEEPYPWNTLACTACEGHCCVQGGGDAFAFQRTDLIQHLRIRHPDLGPGAMQSHFEAALPDQHIKGACLFQGPQGCTLTRDWRADICNTFRCFELEQLARQVDTSKHKALAIFSMHDRSPRRMTAYATKDTSGGDG